MAGLTNGYRPMMDNIRLDHKPIAQHRPGSLTLSGLESCGFRQSLVVVAQSAVPHKSHIDLMLEG